MENKDLNTFFKNGTEDGNGIPYREAYWEKMNTLLDQQMPVKNTVPQSSVPANTMKWFRFFQLLSALSVTSVVLLVAFYPKSSPQSIQSTSSSSDNKSIPEQNTSTPELSDEGETPLAGQITHFHGTSKQTNNSSSDKQQIAISASRPTVKDHSIQNDQEATISLPTNHDNSYAADAMTIPVEGEAILQPAKQQQTGSPSFVETATGSGSISLKNTSIQYKPDKKLIELATNQFLSVRDEGIGQSYINTDHIAFKGQHSFITQLAISPFLGIIHSTKKQHYITENITYQNNPQSNFAFGVNVNMTTKLFSIRTGIGMSRTDIHSSYQTEHPQYKYDTSYTIVKYNYDTTQSGHTVTLIRQQVDSALINRNAQTKTAMIRYQYLTIPLTIQYHFAHKKLTYMAEVGALNNFRISSEVQSSSDRHLHIPRYQMQLTLGSGASYALNSTCEIGMQYNYAFSQQGSRLMMLNNAHAVYILFNYRLR